MWPLEEEIQRQPCTAQDQGSGPRMPWARWLELKQGREAWVCRGQGIMVLYPHIRTLVAPGVPVVSDSERSPPGTKTGLQLWLLLGQAELRRSRTFTFGC